MFLNDFWTFKGRNIHARRVIGSLVWASSIHQYVPWTFSVVLRHETLNTPFFMQYICKTGCQPVWSLTMITHLKKVIVLIKKRHLNSIFHVIIPSSHPLATHSTYSVAILTGTAAEGCPGIRDCTPSSSPNEPQTLTPAALGPHQLVPSTSYTSPLLALPLQLATSNQRVSYTPADCRVYFRSIHTPSYITSANRLWQRGCSAPFSWDPNLWEQNVNVKGVMAMFPSLLPSNNLCQKNMAMTSHQKHSPSSSRSYTCEISSVWILWLLSSDNTESDVKHSKPAMPFLSRTTTLEKIQSQHKKAKIKIWGQPEQWRTANGLICRQGVCCVVVFTLTFRIHYPQKKTESCLPPWQEEDREGTGSPRATQWVQAAPAHPHTEPSLAPGSAPGILGSGPAHTPGIVTAVRASLS